MASIRITGTGTFKSMNENRGVQQNLAIISDTLDQYIKNEVVVLTDEVGPRVARAISQEATKSLRGILPFVGQNLFGTRPGSTDAHLTAFHFGIRGQADDFGLVGRDAVNITWKQLQKKYLQSKEKKANPTFFKLTGELQRLFMHRASADEFALKLGGIRASWVPRPPETTGRRQQAELVEFGTIEVALTPSRIVSPGRFTGPLSTGTVSQGRDYFNPRAAKQLDQSLFKDWEDNTVDKLINRGKPARVNGRFAGRAYRPVMQPAIAVWLLNRIPQSIKNALSRFRIT